MEKIMVVCPSCGDYSYVSDDGTGDYGTCCSCADVHNPPVKMKLVTTRRDVRVVPRGTF